MSQVVRYRAELARCADLLAYQLGKEKQLLGFTWQGVARGAVEASVENC